MKFIVRVKATNLKNRAALDLPLSRLSIITGRNGSGKTSIADAITLAALGYLPDLGKTGPAIAKAAGPGLDMGTALEMTELPEMACRFEYARTWKRTGTGMKKVTAPDEAPPLSIVCLDPDTFLKGNANARAQAIAARFQITTDPKTAIRAAIEATAAGQDIPAAPKCEDFSEWVSTWESDLSEALKEASASARRMKATIEGMAALDETPPALISAETIKEAQQAVGAAAAKVEEIKSKLKTATASHAEKMAALANSPEAPTASREALQKELEEIAAEISKLEAKEHAAKDTGGTRARDAANLEIAEKRLAGIEHWLEQNPEPEEYNAPELPAAHDLGALRAKFYDTSAERIKALAALDAIKANTLTGTHCPCCGSAAQDWDQEKVWQAEESKVAAEARLATAEQADQRAAALFADAEQIEDKRESQRIEKAARAKTKEERATYTQRASETTALLESLTARLADVPRFEQEDAELLEASRTARRETLEGLEEWQQYEAIAALGATVNALAAEIKEATAALEAAYTAYDATVTNAQELEGKAAAAAQAVAAAQTHAAATKEFDKATELAGILDFAREKLREAAQAETLKIFKPLLAIAGPICAGCLPTPLDHKGLDFGRYEGAHFISFDTFSKSEKMAAFAGISAALAAQNAGILIIDEFNNLDAAKRERFLANLSEAIRTDQIAQAILLDNTPHKYTLPEFGSQQALEA